MKWIEFSKDLMVRTDDIRAVKVGLDSYFERMNNPALKSQWVIRLVIDEDNHKYYVRHFETEEECRRAYEKIKGSLLETTYQEGTVLG